MKFSITKEMTKKITELVKFSDNSTHYDKGLTALRVKSDGDLIKIVAFNGNTFYMSVFDTDVNVDGLGEFLIEPKIADKIFKSFVGGTVELLHNEIKFTLNDKKMSIQSLYSEMDDLSFINAENELEIPFSVFKRGIGQCLATTSKSEDTTLSKDFDLIIFKIRKNAITFQSMGNGGHRATSFTYKNCFEFEKDVCVPANKILSKIVSNKSYTDDTIVKISFSDRETQFNIGNDIIKTYNKVCDIFDIDEIINKCKKIKYVFDKKAFDAAVKDVELVLSENKLSAQVGITFKKLTNELCYSAKVSGFNTNGKLPFTNQEAEYNAVQLSDDDKIFRINSKYLKDAVSFLSDEVVMYYNGYKNPIIIENFISDTEYSYVLLMPLIRTKG